ncbi:MAG: hypothetical protein QOI63_718 [Thermoplasmata archaeon]|jgi:hypothetical protein|nr:hypothetical protein [Thermoplasmata archaeon]
MRFGPAALMLAGLVAVAALPAVAAAPPEPQCLQYYSEREVGPVKVVSRDSCHTTYSLCGRTLGDALAAPQPLDCLAITAPQGSPPACYEQYSKTTVGPVTYIRRNSCDPGTLYLCGHNVLFEALDTSCL